MTKTDANTSRLCPRCEVELVDRRLGSEALLACTLCGGVWLDVVACRAIVGGAPSMASLLYLAEQSAAAATVQPAEAVGAACPVCRGSMQRRPVPGVEATLDTCLHGTWFDARELRVVAEALKPVAQVQPAIAAPIVPITPQRSYGDQFDADHVEMAGTLGELFLRFLGSLFDDDQRYR